MSGHPDYPPAFVRDPRDSRYLLLDRLRTFLSSRAQEQGHLQHLRALEALNQELRHLNPERMSSRRVELPRGPSRFNPRSINNSSLDTWHNERSSAMQSRRTLSAAGYPFHGGLRPMEFEGLQTVEQVEERIRQINADMDNFMNGALENTSGVPALSPSRQHHLEDDIDGPRTKRIKLDSDDKREGLRGFQYGHYGQVVPGALEMEIFSCDGGSYEPNGKNSWPGNILINDNSVYCTKSDRCNIILRHPGGIPFCLRKLTIKAPKTGFDSPYSVQEGMVFISMDADNLLSRTAKYEMGYLPPQLRLRRQFRNLDRYMRYSFLAFDRTTLDDPNPDRGLGPHSNSTTVENSSRFASNVRVTIDHDDKSEDEAADESGGEAEQGSNGIDDEEPYELTEFLRPADTDSEDSQDSDAAFQATLQALEQANARRLQREFSHARANPSPPLRRRQALHSPVPVDPLISQDASMEDDPSSPTSPDVLKPHARFFIEREKGKVSIRFDPPASGRYILIKLWSPCRGGNIDIQSIIANGYAGPRFFPALSLR
ncbi:hypothetical protein VTO42DRAFT_5629 [Malbranchea cinnamomea]